MLAFPNHLHRSMTHSRRSSVRKHSFKLPRVLLFEAARLPSHQTFLERFINTQISTDGRLCWICQLYLWLRVSRDRGVLTTVRRRRSGVKLV